MIRLATIFALLALVSGAASCTPALWNGYTFCVPPYHNAIHGEVMGESGDYRMMRYEDAAWIREAYYERLSMQQQNVVTAAPLPLVIGASPVTPADLSNPGWAVDGYLEPDLPLCTSVTNYDPSVEITNLVVISYDAMIGTNSYTNAYSFVTQSMINGQTDIYTNRWLYPQLGRVTTTNTYVRSITALDACFAGGLAVGLTNSPGALLRHEGYWYSRAAVTNWYAHLRRARRLAVNSDYLATNVMIVGRNYRSSNAFNPVNSTYTNYLSRMNLTLTRIESVSEPTGYWRTEGSSVTTTMLEASITSGFPDLLASRIGSVRAYAGISAFGTYGVNTNATSREAHLVYPLGSVNVASNKFVVTLPLRTLASTALDAIDSSIPSADVHVDVGEDENDYRFEASDLETIWFVVEINPSTILEDWNENE